MNSLVYNHIQHLITSVHLVFARCCYVSLSVPLKLVQTHYLGGLLNAGSD